MTGGKQIFFPSDGSSAIIDSELRTDKLLVRDGLTINGLTNMLNGELALASKIYPPPWEPNLTDDYGLTEGIVIKQGDHGFWHTGSVIACANFNSFYLQDTAGTITATAPAILGNEVYLAVRTDGTNWYSLFYRYNIVGGTITLNFYHRTHNLTTLATISTTTVETVTGVTGTNYQVAGGASSTDLYWGYRNISTYSLKRVNTAGTVTTVSTASSISPIFAVVNIADSACTFFVSNADIGASRYWIRSGSGYKSYNSSFVAQSTEDFLTVSGWGIYSPPYWNGTNFLLVKWSPTSNNYVLQQLTNLKAVSQVFGYTFYDSDAAGTGTHETTISPYKTYTPKNRIMVRVTCLSPNDQGGTDDPDALKIYIGTTTGNACLQTTLTGGNVSSSYSTFVTGTATPPATNSFDSVNSFGIIKSDAEDLFTEPYWWLRGDGLWRLGPFKTDFGWVNATLQNSWVHYGAPYAVPAYRNIGKMVMLKGLVKSGSIGLANPIFTLPVGLRPAETLMLTAICNNVTTGAASAGTAHTHSNINTACRVDILTTGEVCVVTSTAANGYISLDGIMFFAD